MIHSENRIKEFSSLIIVFFFKFVLMYIVIPLSRVMGKLLCFAVVKKSGYQTKTDGTYHFNEKIIEQQTQNKKQTHTCIEKDYAITTAIFLT